MGRAFTAWKAVKGNVLLKIEIPGDADWVHPLPAVNNKLRASKVRTIKAYYVDVTWMWWAPFSNPWKFNITPLEDSMARYKSQRGGIYGVGLMTIPDKYDPSPVNVCSNGIHFFMKREDALKYGAETVCWR